MRFGLLLRPKSPDNSPKASRSVARWNSAGRTVIAETDDRANASADASHER